MNKFLIYVNDEREALVMAKDFTINLKKDMYDISQSNDKRGYVILLINNSNFIYIVYDRNVILNNILSEKDFNEYRVFTTIKNTALLKASHLFAAEIQACDILNCIKRDLQTCAYKSCINLQSLIKDVKFNPPATIVFWNDGTKTVVKASEFDDYDPEKGFMLCVMKYLLKPQLTEDKKIRSYYKTITDYTDKFEEEYGCDKGWLEEFIESFYNFTLDDDSRDGDKSTKEPNSTYEKDIDTELKVDENVEDTKSMIDIAVDGAIKTLKDLYKKMLNDIYGSRDNIDAMIYALEASESLEEQTSIGKDIFYSIIDNIRNDPFNKVRFHGKRPNDIKVEEIKSVYVELDETIKNISIIQFCNMQTLEMILANVYRLTTSEIFLYHNNDCDEFIICSNNTAIIMFKGSLTEDYFVSLLDNARRGDNISIEDARYFIEYSYFDKYICDIITHIIDIKGEQ